MAVAGMEDFVVSFSKLVLNMPATYMKQNQINILVFGLAGHGKSATGNSILGETEFEMDYEGENPEDRDIESKSTNYEDYKLNIFESPPAPSKNPTNETQVLKYSGLIMPKLLKICPSGFHKAIVVFRFAHRFTVKDEFVLAMLKAMFGEDYIRDHVICVISNGDTFKKFMKKSKTPQTFNDWCRAQSHESALGKMFQACNYRCVLFDNLSDDVGIKREQLRLLMSMITSSLPQPRSLPVVSISRTHRTKAAIMLMIETAASPEDYQHQLNFAVSYTNSYNTGGNAAQVSVLVIGEKSQTAFDFAQFNGFGHLSQALKNAPYLKPSSGTDKALMMARQKLSCSAYAQHGLKKMLVMVTEGKCKDEKGAVQEAKEIKATDTEIMAVAPSGMNRSTLIDLASSQDEVFIADSYSNMKNLVKDVVKKIAELAPQYKSTADVLFILDSSGSISPEDYQKQLDFATKLTECFIIGPKHVKYSAMIFSNSPQIIYDFNYIDHDQIEKATQAAPHIKGGTNTAAALKLARESAFTSSNGARNGKKIAIVITDGCSDNRRDTAQEAENLTNSGVLILAIGVGQFDQLELELIASMSEDVYMVDDYKLLYKIQEAIAQKTDDLESRVCSRNPKRTSFFQQQQQRDTAMPDFPTVLGFLKKMF